MKSFYKKVYFKDDLWRFKEVADDHFYYRPAYAYGRGSFKTQQERRANYALKADARYEGWKIKNRRLGYEWMLDAWNSEKRPSMDCKKCWKRYNRCRKQYMVNLS